MGDLPAHRTGALPGPGRARAGPAHHPPGPARGLPGGPVRPPPGGHLQHAGHDPDVAGAPGALHREGADLPDVRVAGAGCDGDVSGPPGQDRPGTPARTERHLSDCRDVEHQPDADGMGGRPGPGRFCRAVQRSRRLRAQRGEHPRLRRSPHARVVPYRVRKSGTPVAHNPAGGHPLRLANPPDPFPDGAGYVRRAVGRRRLPAADLCGGNPSRRPPGLRLASGRPRRRRILHGHPPGLPASHAARGPEPPVGRGGIRRGHDRLRFFSIVLAVAGDAFPHRRFRQRQHGRPAHARPVADDQPDARPRARRQLRLHWRFQRTRRPGVRPGRPLVRTGRLGGQRRHRDRPRCPRRRGRRSPPSTLRRSPRSPAGAEEASTAGNQRSSETELKPSLFTSRGPASRVRRTLPVLLACIAYCAAPAVAQRFPPPDAPWRTLDTEHFRITFPGHLEALARRAAGQAEWAHARLSEHFVHGPEGPIDIVLTDHTDVSNGYATPFPSNRIVLFARPPVDSFQLGYFDDWQQLLIVHELTHIFHLNRPGRYSVRGLFGRIPAPVFGFPALTSPRWVIEGIGTWYESALTGRGRVLGTFNEMVLRTAALEGRFETIGQAGGPSPQWPGGNRAYTYGPMFFEYLLRKHGRDRMEAFVEAVEKQWIPYRLNAAGRSAFGVSMSHEWAAWADAWRDSAAGLDARLARFGAITEPERLTDGARYADHPKVSPDGSALIYIRSDGRSDTRLVSAYPNGGRESTIARTRGRRFTFAPNGDIVVDQLEFSGRYRIFRDLYRVTPDGAVQRLTNAARLSAPSAGPGDRVVAVAEGEGTNGLVRVNTNTGAIDTLVRPEEGVYWAFPGVSPDGRRIAATRWSGGNQDIVVLDERGGLVSQVTRDRALDFAPAWSPDGRWLVWASDRTGILNILAARFDGAKAAAPVMLTNVRTGAAMPSVDPSGKWLYVSGYHVDGWEVERIPFDPDHAPLAPEHLLDSTDSAAGRTAREVAAIESDSRAPAGGQIRAYSPLQTLLPRFWIPVGSYSFSGAGSGTNPRTKVLGASVGAFTSGVDLVGRHTYALTARAFLPTGGYSGGRGAGLLTYRYAGLGNPALGLTASQSWDEERVRVRKENGDAPVDTTFVLERTRYAGLSVGVARPRAWSNLSLTLSGGVLREDREAVDSALKPK